MSLQFDPNVLVLEHRLLLLELVSRGVLYPRHGLPYLTKRGLARFVGYPTRCEPTLLGVCVANGLVPGALVRVHTSHRIKSWHGLKGNIVSVRPVTEDANGYDDYGYVIEREKPGICITVRMRDRTGDHTFWNANDLISIFG